MGTDVPEPFPVEETRGGESPEDWQCGTAQARAEEIQAYIRETYGSEVCGGGDTE